MKIDNYINKIEEVVEGINKPTNNKLKDEGEQSSVIDFIKLLLGLTLDIFKLPLKFLSNIIKNEIVSAIRKDAKLYTLLMGIMGVLFVFFSVIWLFISIAVGAYFYENGSSLFISISFSILFQIISFIIVLLIAYIASKNITSLKMLKKTP